MTDEETLFTIECQEKVLTWITLSFFNYYGFLVITYVIVLMSANDERQKTKRFKFSLFMLCLFVPFMLVWNMYGNFMIHQDYFAMDYTNGASTHSTY